MEKENKEILGQDELIVGNADSILLMKVLRNPEMAALLTSLAKSLN